MLPKTTIVVPCYNEERRLPINHFAKFVMAARAHQIRFLLGNDGSRDGTLGVLRQLSHQSPETFEVLDVAKNSGKADAVRSGILRALDSEPQLIGYWDADLATPLTAIPDFLDVMKRFPQIEVCMGSRVMLLGRRIERRWTRHVIGRCFATCASMVLALRVYDTQCGAKLLRVQPWTRALFESPFRSRWIFDVELLSRMSQIRQQNRLSPLAELVYELPLDDWRDVDGSKLRAKDFVKAAGELFDIWWNRRRYSVEVPAGAILTIPMKPAEVGSELRPETSTRAA